MGKNEFSPSTKMLVERMMKEKQVSRRQQKAIAGAISSFQALPVERNSLIKNS